MLRLPPAAMAELTRAFATDLPVAWRRARDRHPDQTPYAFVLHGSEGGERPKVWPVVLTEQGLDVVAQQYVDSGNYETRDEAREALRWSVPAAPDAYEWVDGMPTVAAAIAQHIGTDIGDATGYQWLADAAVPVWREMDKAGTFGTGSDRNRLLVGFMLFDVAADDTLGTIPLLNPPAMVEQYELATAVPTGPFVSCGTLVASADGSYLFASGSRKDRGPGDGERVSEVIAYAVIDGRVDRRWTYSFPGFGDSGVSLAPAADGRSVVVVRARHVKVDRKRASLVRPVRLSIADGRVLAEAEFDGQATPWLALSPDGGNVALGVGDEELAVLDAGLNRAGTLPLPSRCRSLLWLGSGELIAATRGEVLRLDPATGRTTGSHPCPAERLSANRDQSVVAVSGPAERRRLMPKIEFADREPEPETVITLLRLPSLDPIRTVGIPGHQLTLATLSPDGDRLAVEARPVGKKWQFVVVLDLANGRELARRKMELIHDFAFISGGHVLAIATSGYGAAAAVDLWELPR